MIQGTVFSIEEFSIYDGPGMRTTVFFKGCPLRCMWCHSPEGQEFTPQILRSPNGCIGCLACLKKGEELTGKPVLVPESIHVCPHNLVRMSGDSYSPLELVEKLKKNVQILNASGGGVTFSGGEPLSQATFVTQCFRLLDGVTHRALQTCGFCPTDTFSEVMEVTDYVLFDLKLMNSKEHVHYCGQDNEQILQNYRLLASSEKPFCTRMPLIPTVNDTVENICATAAFLKKNNVTYIELLPYHKLTGSKYALCGKTYRPEFDESIPPNPHTDIFQSFGIEVTIL